MGQGVSRDNYLKSIDTVRTEKVSSESQIWDIILAVPPEDETIYDTIRQLKESRPDNLSIFINKLVNQLVKVKGVNREKNTNNDYNQTNISLAYLTRVLPIVFENDKNDFIEKVFWLNEIPEINQINQIIQQQQQQSPTPIHTNTTDIKANDLVTSPIPIVNTDSEPTTTTVDENSPNNPTTTTEESQDTEDDNGKEPISPHNVDDKQIVENILTENEKEIIARNEELHIQSQTGQSSSSLSIPKQPEQLQQQQQTSPKNIHSTDLVPLAVKLMESLLELLFLPGYTVDLSLGVKNPRIDNPDSLPLNFVWLPGFGVETVPTYQTKQFWINRLNVLQCLLTTISGQLYISQEHVSNFRSKWLLWLTEEQDYHTEALFYSLINSFSTYDPIGWGIPYNHLMFADDHEAAAKLSIQVLNVLLSFDPYVTLQHPPSQSNSPNEPHLHSASSSSLPSQQQQQQQHQTISNRFIRLLKSQKRARDFKFFFQAFERIINLPMIANHTRLPHSTKKIEIHQDIFITFWRFITINQDFLKFIIAYETSPEFIVPLMQYMDEGRKNQTTHGIIQIGTFILLVLSGERDFAISMNKPFNAKVYIDIPPSQVYSDFFINVMYRLLVDTAERLESIYECILTVLSNLSPYMKNLSMVTCVKLMKLFEFLSSPRFLFQTSHNHRYVGLLLESFNHLLQYQYESNTRLIYAILRCQNQFSKLAYLKITPITPNRLNQQPQPSPNSNPTEALDKLNKLSISSPQTTTTTEDTSSEVSNTQQNPNESSSSLSPSNSDTSIPNMMNEQRDEAVKGTNPTSAVEYPIGIKATSTTTPIDQSPSLDPNIKTTITTTMSTQFIPTDEWLQDIKRHLPLDNILRVITNLSPQIQSLCTNSGNDEQRIMEYLKMSTIVGLFHSSNTIITRKYHQNSVIRSWFIAYMWCIIYLENHSPPLFLKTAIKLFQIKK
ncbi:hypothetical protein DLAC_11787 [Tieghemostelium lacteum]|uniref:Uncharacterized protein n=1 Tax=Tieghemostelium lacteum TaxID=361077 RepID=A0A151Z742_TIELA|nr:hypothetical protein DLAC_11787 [Tieghemostelium lacteum]|eukprot:KYQ89779.1 hypothetical protein DLAC_11787 [Tieghemostelium lacteum]